MLPVCLCLCVSGCQVLLSKGAEYCVVAQRTNAHKRSDVSLHNNGQEGLPDFELGKDFVAPKLNRLINAETPFFATGLQCQARTESAPLNPKPRESTRDFIIRLLCSATHAKFRRPIVRTMPVIGLWLKTNTTKTYNTHIYIYTYIYLYTYIYTKNKPTLHPFGFITTLSVIYIYMYIYICIHIYIYMQICV